MKDWSDPQVRLDAFAKRICDLRREVDRWQGKCSVLRHENNRLRAKFQKTTAAKTNG